MVFSSERLKQVVPPVQAAAQLAQVRAAEQPDGNATHDSFWLMSLTQICVATTHMVEPHSVIAPGPSIIASELFMAASAGGGSSPPHAEAMNSVITKNVARIRPIVRARGTSDQASVALSCVCAVRAATCRSRTGVLGRCEPGIRASASDRAETELLEHAERDVGVGEERQGGANRGRMCAATSSEYEREVRQRGPLGPERLAKFSSVLR
jgi:hypothetical protein